MPPRSSWSTLFGIYRSKMDIDQDVLAKTLRVSQATISNYESGRSLPPLDSIRDLCDLLDLTGNERQTFIEEAYLAHAPDRVRSIVADLRQRIARLERLSGLKPEGP